MDAPAAASTRAVVIEFGSRIVRAGFAGEASPRLTLPVETFGVSFSSSLTTEDLRHVCLGFLSSLFVEHLHVKSKDSTVLIVEPLVSSSKFREALVYVLFKYLFVAKVSLQPDLFMPILTTGLYTGIILDIGFSETRCIAVLQGRPLLNTIRMGKIGVRSGIDYLRRSLQLNSKMVNLVSAESIFCQVASYNVINFREVLSYFTFMKATTELNVGVQCVVVPADIRRSSLRVIAEGEGDDGGK